MDDLFKALADSSRRHLLDELRGQDGLTLAELCESLDMSRQAVSKHLAILETANLVVTLKEGRYKKHYLNPVPLQQIVQRWVGQFEAVKADALIHLKHKLEQDHD